ncbi:HlyD family efflux transporter periplasmic adaptor subunit [Candidatus Kirkpatrickella diaphorinae]|uniref:HlyD family efflux transporter periplasmic adaptor subunit n=1 Tax=Candidatus Kirkpatrickella diaphorinae TaxID=2984322 RepID=A0ABY6GHZ9_9PROT|nr:HlyD family efflux transporter periplasmic adaptor subunit [Candidatus Kirkpatrickella diaphorinae]UYH50879.1 HlyD family efflux transporter periplasmic adaptor subunit [Candidatus Kirkpatrickella diaphorinae]
MANQDSRPLFRQEALQWRQESWMGATCKLAPISGRWVALGAGLFFVAICVYGVLGSYTRRVHAAGALVPTAGLVVMTADQIGIVTQIHVREGQHVKAGDRLFSLDVAHRSELDVTGRNALETLRAQYRLLQEKRRLAEKDAPIALFTIKAHLATLDRQRAMLKAQIARDEKILPLVDRATKQMQDAIGTRLVTQTQFQSQLNVYFQSFNVHAQMVRALIDVEGQRSADQLKILQHPIEWARRLNEIDTQLADCRRQISQASRETEAILDARIAGTIDGITSHVGQHVRNDQPLLTILPDHATLLAELFVSSRAVGFIHVGQPVLLKYAPYPYQRFGLYQGRVIEVTRSPIQVPFATMPRKGGVAPDGPDADQYRIRVRPARDIAMVYGRPEKLQPGMKLEAEIAVDHRRLYQWLLDPFISSAMKLRQISQKDGGGVTT